MTDAQHATIPRPEDVRRELARACAAVVGAAATLSSPEELLAYDVDGFTLEKHPPDVVVLPRRPRRSPRCCGSRRDRGVPVTARGAGTGLAGGALPAEGGIVLSTARMDRILALEPEDRFADRAAGRRQPAPLARGRAVRAPLRARSLEPDGLDARWKRFHQRRRAALPQVRADARARHGAHVRARRRRPSSPPVDRVPTRPGSTWSARWSAARARARSSPSWSSGSCPCPRRCARSSRCSTRSRPRARAVSAIIAHGIIPAALEMLDHLDHRRGRAERPPRAAARRGRRAPGRARRPGRRSSPRALARRCARCARSTARARCARRRTPTERALLWKARKGAFGAMGRIANGFYVMDGVVPRTRLPEALRAIAAIGQRHDLRIANVFHAGDGNLHPNVLYDVDDPDVGRARARGVGGDPRAPASRSAARCRASTASAARSADLMGLLFSRGRPRAVHARCASAFDPSGGSIPRKILPLGKGCGEARSLMAPRARGRRVRGRHRGRRAVDLTPAARPCGCLKRIAAGPSDWGLVPTRVETPRSGAEAARLLAEAARAGTPQWIVGAASRLAALPAGAALGGRALDRGPCRRRRLRAGRPHADRRAPARRSRPCTSCSSRTGSSCRRATSASRAGRSAGSVATNLADARRASSGPVRDRILGMEIATSDGKVTRSGGRVVKNVAGYDVGRLIAGSCGGLALVTEVTLRLAAAPRGARAVHARVRRRARGGAARARARARGAVARLRLGGRARNRGAADVGARGRRRGGRGRRRLERRAPRRRARRAMRTTTTRPSRRGSRSTRWITCAPSGRTCCSRPACGRRACRSCWPRSASSGPTFLGAHVVQGAVFARFDLGSPRAARVDASRLRAGRGRGRLVALAGRVARRRRARRPSRGAASSRRGRCTSGSSRRSTRAGSLGPPVWGRG